ncbi:MAG: 4-hydroxybenzoate octaprenyltransferase [Gammaproteobacteria bacterium]|nr:MAG: 4-hydroxybenzoate octaprenyltransferase [Gammaproteobacteria bacterium]TND02934.1 MAG: 4-hydroxybenzoate octaprenyltransferase [Gammaproteobacteria bacterium]
MRARVRSYVALTRLDRPIGIFLLLWPTWSALWIAAEGAPDALVLLVFTAGVVLMRSAGCVINDYADRNIDIHVGRTLNRPLASGKVSTREAAVLFILLAGLAFLLVLLMNRLTILLSLAAVGIAVVYPFMKRITHLPQVVLGIAFGWAVPMAFAAQGGAVPQVAWLLMIATVLWTVAYDTMYAMVDRDDDLRIGVKSTAILFGEADRLVIGLLQAAVLLILLLIGHRLELSYFYNLGLGVAAILALYQQYLLWYRQPDQCFAAFLNNNYFGMAVFAGIFLHFQAVGH